MNRHCYRVLFNRARGLFVVCQENARSAGGASSASASASPSPAASALRFAAVSLVAAACALLSVDPAHGQIIADPSASGRQRPTVLSAPNGVPVVNIQTPSAAGVSHNTYRQFDVNTPGAILNNSRGNVQTQLGGWVQGNPWLAKGPARVILNEVNSSHPSLLRGAVEVAGPRAEVIIANPSGISVDGGSFINTSRVTLTTGSPVMNAGNLESYRVQRGNVLFEGRGLDAGATDYTAVLARAVQVNAGIWAKALKVVAGAHEASADGSVATPIAGTGPAPTFLLDVAAPGGRIVFFGGTLGNIPDVPPAKVFWKQLSILGSTMGTEQDFEDMLALVTEKQIVPVVDEVFPLADGEAALRRLDAGAQFGKVVLQIA